MIIGTREEFDMMEVFEIIRTMMTKKPQAKWFDYSAKIVVIKHGKEGSIAYTQDGESHKGADLSS